MFTGIIQATGSIVDIQNTKQGRFIAIKTDQKIVRRVPEGGSVSVDGVCLTALRRARGMLTFELMNSTLKRTTLGALKVGDRVNVEPAILAGQPIGGHFISGHVDGVGRVHKVSTRWHTKYLVIEVPKHVHRYLVPQGSAVVSGVSLTVVEVSDVRRTVLRRAGGPSSVHPWFSVALTSYTLEHTNLGKLKVGNRVNIEVDMLAKYLSRFLEYYAIYNRGSKL